MSWDTLIVRAPSPCPSLHRPIYRCPEELAWDDGWLRVRAAGSSRKGEMSASNSGSASSLFAVATARAWWISQARFTHSRRNGVRCPFVIFRCRSTNPTKSATSPPPLALP